MKLNKSYLVPFVEVLSKGISFINVLLLIRIFSMEDYAEYSYILAIVLWTSVLMDGGITNLIYTKSLNNDNRNMNTLFSARLVLSFSIITLLSFFFLVNNPDFLIILLILSFVIFFSSTSSLLKMFARGNGFTDVDLVIIISEPLIRLIFLLIIYFTINSENIEFYQILLIYLLAGIVAFSINYKKLGKYFKFKFVTSERKSHILHVKKVYQESKYYLLYYLMIVGIGRIDIIFIEKYGNATDLAIFASALNIYQVAQLFFFTIITSQFLLLIKNKDYLYKYLIPVLILVIVATIFTSKYIYLYLFPEAYYNGYIILNFIILALLPSVLNYYIITKNNYINLEKINFYVLFIFLIIKVGLYQFLKSDELRTYYTIFPIIEIGILITYLMHIKFYESTSNQ